MILYSSMYINGKIDDITKIELLYDNHMTVLFFDTNICIDLYHLWCNPHSFIEQNKEMYNEFLTLAKTLYSKNISFFPVLGIDESSRQYRNGHTSEEKENNMSMAIRRLLMSSFSFFLEHTNSNYVEEPIIQKKELNITNIRFIKNDNLRTNMLLIKYCSMLKLNELLLDNIDYKARIFSFFDFLIQEMNCLDGGSLTASILLSNSSTIKSFFHKKGNRIENVLGSILNAALDLCQIEMYAGEYINGLFPVLVTCDKTLYKTRIQV